jgi:hypothetical protein
MNKNIFKSIGAVIAGFLTAIFLTVGTDAVMEGIGFFSTNPETYTSRMLFVALVYRTVFTGLGGFVIGKLAPYKPMNHVAVMAVISALLGIGGIVAEWNMIEHWFPITQAVLAFPFVWYGGKLALNRKVYLTSNL